MTNTSATGGYLQSQPLASLPQNLTFKQFLQTVFVGISGLDGDLVRPSWQINPPKQPDINTNWVAIALTDTNADTNMFVGQDSSSNNITQRMEEFQVKCSFYGPDSFEVAQNVRDGLQINQNLEALLTAGMGFVNTDRIIHVPDLINERWVDRFEMNVILRRQISRVYPILTFLSVGPGALKTVVSGNVKTIAINSNE